MRPLAFLPLSEDQLSKIHRSLYLLGLFTIAIGMPWLKILMSIGQFILAGNWLLEGRFLEKWENFKRNKSMQLLLSIIFLVLLGFLWSENIQYALKDARIKFPLFLLPFIIGSSEPLTKKEWQFILSSYLLTLILLYSASLGKLFGIIGDKNYIDKRELSIFISHIRYGLNLLLGSFLAFYFRDLFGKEKRWILLTVCLILFSSLITLELYTALGIGLLIIVLWLVKLSLNQNKKRIKLITLSSLGIAFFSSIILFSGVYRDYHDIPDLNYDQNIFVEKSAKGNNYMHIKEDRRKEKGVFIWRYIQKEELRANWNERSELDFDGKDNKGNEVFQTLVRFLSSKGLMKDERGMKKLSEAEIKAIENGIPNRYYLDHFAFQNRIYTTLYELENYNQFGYADGYSLGMRIEYWKTAWKIIQKNMWTGVGTGDVPQAFELQYYLDDSSLSEKFRRRAHNQFLTIWLTFGIGGLIYFLYYLIKPLYTEPHSIYTIFFLITFLSFFTEDTLETQAGVTFFAFFNSLFILSFNQLKSSE